MKINLPRKIVILGFIVIMIQLIAAIGSEAYIAGPICFYYGRVRDVNGHPVSGATITLYKSGVKISSGRSAYDGFYVVQVDRLLFSGTLKVEKTDWISQTKFLSAQAGPYNFNLQTSSWALIVGGSKEVRFTRDSFTMYNTLIDHYSFSANRIYLLTTDETFVDFTEDGTIGDITVPRDRVTNRANVEWATNQIDLGCKSTDDVFIFWTGHGLTNTFNTYTDDITATQFDSYLDDITCQRMFIYLGPCHSGSFIDNLNDTSNRAIYTSCKANQAAYMDYWHSYWPDAIMRAMDNYFDAKFADDNNDNRVSLWEIWDYTYNQVIDECPNQTPQRWVGSGLGDDRNNYIGDQYY